MDVTVCIGTFGQDHWTRLATTRAAPSAESQAPVIHVHGETLAKARNAALAQVDTEWVIHLDADDELSPDYVKAMGRGTADLRVPSVSRIGRGPVEPKMPCVYGHDHQCTGECLRYGNWIVIGACVRTELVRSIGWEEFGWSEDWALWARCWKAGATVEPIPDAVYIAYHNRLGRNRVSRHASLDWHTQIEKAVWPEEPSVL